MTTYSPKVKNIYISSNFTLTSRVDDHCLPYLNYLPVYIFAIPLIRFYYPYTPLKENRIELIKIPLCDEHYRAFW